MYAMKLKDHEQVNETISGKVKEDCHLTITFQKVNNEDSMHDLMTIFSTQKMDDPIFKEMESYDIKRK